TLHLLEGDVYSAHACASRALRGHGVHSIFTSARCTARANWDLCVRSRSRRGGTRRRSAPERKRDAPAPARWASPEHRAAAAISPPAPCTSMAPPPSMSNADRVAPHATLVCGGRRRERSPRPGDADRSVTARQVGIWVT